MYIYVYLHLLNYALFYEQCLTLYVLQLQNFINVHKYDAVPLTSSECLT